MQLNELPTASSKSVTGLGMQRTMNIITEKNTKAITCKAFHMNARTSACPRTPGTKFHLGLKQSASGTKIS